MTFEEIAAALRERLATLEPDCYSGVDAARHAEVTAEIRNLGETATVLLAIPFFAIWWWMRVCREGCSSGMAGGRSLKLSHYRLVGEPAIFARLLSLRTRA